MTLAKLFTLWKLQDIKFIYNQIYQLEGTSICEVVVNKQSTIAARILYRLHPGENPGPISMISADIYLPGSKYVLVENAKISQLLRYIKNYRKPELEE